MLQLILQLGDLMPHLVQLKASHGISCIIAGFTKNFTSVSQLFLNFTITPWTLNILNICRIDLLRRSSSHIISIKSLDSSSDQVLYVPLSNY